jgi:hypothetical protein
MRLMNTNISSKQEIMSSNLISAYFGLKDQSAEVNQKSVPCQDRTGDLIRVKDA